MNPIGRFETLMERACKAEIPLQEKSRQLRSIGSAIDHYLERIDEAIRIPHDKHSEWQRLKLERAKAYLAQLAEDSRKLAEGCLAATELASVLKATATVPVSRGQSHR
ncbi:MAG: hypothetical protein P4L46_00175 [Fimbriimonas sp.]|nr:hypothetical protein [Fimbriimonas sp.]